MGAKLKQAQRISFPGGVRLKEMFSSDPLPAQQPSADQKPENSGFNSKSFFEKQILSGEFSVKQDFCRPDFKNPPAMVVIRGAFTDPALTGFNHVSVKDTSDISAGLEKLASLLPETTRFFITRTENFHDQVSVSVSKNQHEERFQTAVALDRYPAENPWLLAKVLSRTFADRQQNFWCLDLEAVRAAGENVRLHLQRLSRRVLLNNAITGERKFCRPSEDEKYAQLFGVSAHNPDGNRFAINGLLTGREVNPQSIVKSDTLAVTLLPANFSKLKIMPCVQCGKCSDVCPAGLYPFHLYRLLSNSLTDEAACEGLNECISCGCCDYVCPSGLKLRSVIFSAKGTHVPRS